MRALQLIYSRNFAGSEQFVLTLGKALEAKGVETFIATKSGGSLGARLVAEGLRVVDIPLNSFFAKRRLLKWVKDNRIDVIHAHLTHAARFAYWLHQKTGIPIVAHLHIYRNDPIYRKVANVGTLIAISKDIAEFYIKTANIPPQKIRTIYNATEAVYSPLCEKQREELAAELRNKLKLPQDARLIAFCGRVSPEKGHETVWRAMPRVLSLYPNAHLLVAGNLKQKPAFVKKLRKLRAQLGLEPNIHFLGFRDDVLRITRAAEMQLIPSKCEPFGLVAIEAMALGTPVIGSNTGAIPDILEDGDLGLITPYGDASELAAAIVSVFSNPEAARIKAEAARQKIQNFHTPEKMTKEILRVYKTQSAQ